MKKESQSPAAAKPVKAPAKPQTPAPGSTSPGSSAAGFDIESPELPAAIDKAALTSGGFPYDKKMKRKHYDKELVPLQIELLKLQSSVIKRGERMVIIFEGRDAAGKGGTIARFMQHLNPRAARVVALTKPTDLEKGEWYFQRYAARLPTAGEIVLFDRSWYNRAGVERVMNFCTKDQLADFLREAPNFEGMLVRDGIKLVKFYLSIGHEMQLKRFHARHHDPLKRWKLTPIDYAALGKWDDYSAALVDMLHFTSTDSTPWTMLRANDKLRTRINALKHVLSTIDYEDKDKAIVGTPDPKIVGTGNTFFGI